VAKVIDVISRAAEFSYPQGRALLDKVKAEMGTDVSKWSADNIKKLGKLLKDLDVQDLKKILKQQFKVLQSSSFDYYSVFFTVNRRHFRSYPGRFIG
jgi:uncharacterized protein YaaN involved in tellurite resistance